MAVVGDLLDPDLRVDVAEFGGEFDRDDPDGLKTPKWSWDGLQHDAP